MSSSADVWVPVVWCLVGSSRDLAEKRQRTTFADASTMRRIVDIIYVPEPLESKDSRETHEKVRAATRVNAERKACSLSKHRPALVRWTSPIGDAACSPATTSCRRPPRKDATSTTIEKNKNDNSSSGSGCNDTPSNDSTIFRSGLLSLASAEGLGRHLVAGETAIPAGTLLLRERPFAWSLLPEFVKNTCAECLHKVAGSTTLCPHCGLVAFCSVACATAACKTWHGSECVDASGAPLEAALSAISPECRAALRAVRRAKQDELLTDGSETCEPPTPATTAVSAAATDADASTVIVGTCAGSSVTSTIVHDTTLPIKLDDLDEHYTLRPSRERSLLETEAAIAAVLASGGCADVDAEGVGGRRRNDQPGSEVCGSLAAELVTTLFKISTNAFAISTLRCSEPATGHVQSLTHTRLGIGLYCEAAMFNHSCVPNALVKFSGSEMSVVATRHIEKGAPVTVSYGPLASKVASSLERQAFLQKGYFFLCKCPACSPELATSHQSNERASPLEEAAARSEMTDFACMEDGCSGTLLKGVPPPPQNTLRHGQVHEKNGAPTAAAVAPGSSSSKSAVWCGLCGTVVSPAARDRLIGENQKDRRLWEEAMAAVAYAERVQVLGAGSRHRQPEIGSDSGSGSGSGSKPSPGRVSSESSAEAGVTAAAVAAALVRKRASWRDRRLSSRSSRRATAHDTHAKLLAMDDNFAGAAEACTRSVQVLENNYAPEDQELGFEYLKLAELCLNADLVERCMAACQKARVSLEVCLAPNDEMLRALNNMQAMCSAYGSRKFR